jgi:predicted O-methyltransferase YrrM
LTGVPVNETILRKNMAAAGLDESQYSLVKALSQSDEAIEALKGQLFDVLVIDGDHSYAGVKTDFDLYGSLVRRGGFIIFDDYDVKDWPDIKTYVDDEVMDRPELALVGADFRTAVFRVVKKLPKLDEEPAKAPARRSTKRKS